MSGALAPRARWLPALLAALAAALPVTAQEAPSAAPEPRPFDVLFDARIVPTERVARATISLGRGASNVNWLRFSIDPERHGDFRGDGQVDVEGDKVFWRPPRRGGRLRYTFRIDRLRNASSYDARCAENWALFRGDHLFPPARINMADGATSRSRMRLRAPDGWSVVAPYERRDGVFLIDHEHRRLKRPTGWVVMGRLGVLRERIAGVRVAVAGPVGQGVRRQDMMAFLRWTLPSLKNMGWALPERLLIVGAGDPMWRGGLSAPRSVYLHAARPLISPDLSSPLLHEVVHAVTHARSGPGGDWVVEGLAELYSLEALVRSKTVSRRRYEKALAKLAERGQRAPRLAVDRADGDVTARAVTLLHDLDREIQRASEERARLDDVVARFIEWRRAVTPQLLREAVADAVGHDLEPFFRARVPGTRRIEQGDGAASLTTGTLRP